MDYFHSQGRSITLSSLDAQNCPKFRSEKKKQCKGNNTITTVKSGAPNEKK